MTDLRKGKGGGRLKIKVVIWFLLGAACFILSQPLTRLPILAQLQQSTDFTLAYTLNPLIIGIVIALSAGVFEEGARFLFKQFLLKPDKCVFMQPILFGLGHGIAEAAIILVPALIAVPLSQLGLAFLERALAITLHVTLTVVVWNGFQKNRRIYYLLAAVAIHGFVDTLIPILSPLSNSILLIGSALAAVDVLMVIYAVHSRKYYIKRGNGNEKINV
mgnify:CR=1 FL=1